MIASVVRVGLVVAIATCALIAVAQLAPERRAVAVSVYLLLLGAVALRLLLRAVQLAFTDPPPGPSELDAALVWRPPPPAPPAELEALRRTLVLASVSGVYAHERLRPELRSLAAELLAWRRRSWCGRRWRGAAGPRSSSRASWPRCSITPSTSSRTRPTRDAR